MRNICICKINWLADGDRFQANSTLNKEGNVLFNDALNTFYLRLYGVKHMVKDHSDSERGNPLLPHRLLFPINSKGSFICIIPYDPDTNLEQICKSHSGDKRQTLTWGIVKLTNILYYQRNKMDFRVVITP